MNKQKPIDKKALNAEAWHSYNNNKNIDSSDEYAYTEGYKKGFESGASLPLQPGRGKEEVLEKVFDDYFTPVDNDPIMKYKKDILEAMKEYAALSSNIPKAGKEVTDELLMELCDIVSCHVFEGANFLSTETRKMLIEEAYNNLSLPYPEDKGKNSI